LGRLHDLPRIKPIYASSYLIRQPLVPLGQLFP
jgi:hypothetical protein